MTQDKNKFLYMNKILKINSIINNKILKNY